MAVTLSKETSESHSGEATSGETTYERSFLVSFDSKGTVSDVAAEVYSTWGIRLGVIHPENAAARCYRMRVNDNGNGLQWSFVASYTTSRERRIEEDPIDDAVRVRWGTERYQEVAVVDEDGEAVVNSAGDPYDPPIMKDFNRRVAYVRVNVASVPSWILSYEDAVNSDIFTVGGYTAAVGEAKCQHVALSEEQERNGITFYELTLEIHFAKNGWINKPLDAGFRRIYSGTLREKISWENADGDVEYPVAPVPLDGSGVELVDPTPATAVYRSHVIYETLPFSALPL